MSELREDPTTGERVAISPARAQRPHPGPPATDQACPFCPGNESLTPTESWRLPDRRGRWQVRAFPNRFPIFEPPQGRHEVIVDSPRHDWDIASASEAEVHRLLRAYRARYLALRSERPALISVFRNRGDRSGASLRHPHSQVVAAPLVPGLVRRRLETARRHFDATGRCLYVELVEGELTDRRRLLTATDQVVAFVPRAATVPYEIWIAPRSHASSFGAVSDKILASLAPVLRECMRALSTGLADPPYNLVIDSVPPAEEQVPYFGWLIRILPRTTVAAGFELATGMAVNPNLPEEDAMVLRRALERERSAPLQVGPKRRSA